MDPYTQALLIMQAANMTQKIVTDLLDRANREGRPITQEEIDAVKDRQRQAETRWQDAIGGSGQ